MSEPGPTLASFATGLGVEVAQLGDSVGLRRVLAGLYEAASATWPSLSLSATEFAGYLGERVALTSGEPLLASLHELRVGDLFLACACARGDESAMVLFESHFDSKVDMALSRLNLSESMTEDVKQRLRQQLFVPTAGDRAGITKYAGSGSLNAWLSVTAIRLAMKVYKRENRDARAVDEHLRDVTPVEDDLEISYLKNLYSREFKAAMADALAALTARERNLLRHQFLDGMSIDEIGALYNVHRATAARWLEKTRRALARDTRLRMVEQLQIPDQEYDSILRLIESQIELSICRHLTPAPE